jgi:hypothetical protein
MASEVAYSHARLANDNQACIEQLAEEDQYRIVQISLPGVAW